MFVGDASPVRPTRLLSTLVITLACLSLAGCGKKKEQKKAETKQVTKPAPPPAPPPPKVSVPFAGTYTMYAQATWKNGRRVSVGYNNANATLTITDGRATYDQTYLARGKKNRVIQVYTFNQAAMRPVAGGYDVPLVFQSISGDTQSYSPDKNNPKIEARKQAGGWQIGLLTTDNNGVMGGVEFK